MTNVQFYLIETDDPAEQFSYALQLAMQQLARGKHLHIHTGSAKDTRQMLEQCAEKLSHGDDRLAIDHKGEPDGTREVLLNLSGEVPHFFSSFDTTLEIICTGSHAKDMGRERYKYYKSRGYPLLHSKIPAQLAL